MDSNEKIKFFRLIYINNKAFIIKFFHIVTTFLKLLTKRMFYAKIKAILLEGLMKIDFENKIIEIENDGKINKTPIDEMVGYTYFDGVGLMSKDKTVFFYGETAQRIDIARKKEDGTLDYLSPTFEIDGQKYFFADGQLMREPKGPFFATAEGKKGKVENYSKFDEKINYDLTTNVSYYEQKTSLSDSSKQYISQVGVSAEIDAPLIKFENTTHSFKIIEKDSQRLLVIKPTTPEMEEAFKAKFGDPDSNGFYEVIASDCIVTTTNQIEITLDGDSGKIVANGGQIKFTIGDKEQIVEAENRGFDITYSPEAIEKLLDAKDETLSFCEAKATGVSSLYSNGHLKFNSLPFDFVCLIAEAGITQTTPSGATYKKIRYGATEILTCEIDGKPFMMINDNGTSYVYHGSTFYPLSKETEAAKFKEKETGLNKLGLFYTVASKTISDQIAVSFDASDDKQTDLMQVIHDFDLKKSAAIDVKTLKSKRAKTTTYTPIQTNKYKPFGIVATSTKPEPVQIKGEEIKEKTKTDPQPPQPPKDDKEAKKKRSAFWDTIATGFAYTSLMAFLGAALLGMPIFALIGVLLLGATFMCKGFAAAGGFGFGQYDTSNIEASTTPENVKDKSIIKEFEKHLGLTRSEIKENAKFRKRQKQIEKHNEDLNKLIQKLNDPSMTTKAREKLEKQIAKIQAKIGKLEKENTKFLNKLTYENNSTLFGLENVPQKNEGYAQLIALMGPKPKDYDETTFRECDDRILDKISEIAYLELKNDTENLDLDFNALPENLKIAMANLLPAERAYVLESIKDSLYVAYNNTYPEDIKDLDKKVTELKESFYLKNKDFNPDDPALALSETDFVQVVDDPNKFTYTLPDGTTHTITKEQLDVIIDYQKIMSAENCLNDCKARFDKTASETYKDITDYYEARGSTTGKKYYIPVDRNGKSHPDLKVDASDKTASEMLIASAKRNGKMHQFTKLVQKTDRLDTFCSTVDSVDYAKIQLSNMKTVTDLKQELSKKIDNSEFSIQSDFEYTELRDKDFDKLKTILHDDFYLSEQQIKKIVETNLSFNEKKVLDKKLKEKGFTQKQIDDINAVKNDIEKKKLIKQGFDKTIISKILAVRGLPNNETKLLKLQELESVLRRAGYSEKQIQQASKQPKIKNLTELTEELKAKGFTEEQIEKITHSAVTKNISTIESEIRREQKEYKENVEKTTKILENNPELQERFTKLLEGKTAQEQEKLKKIMDEMIRNKKLNSLQKLIAFCDNYTEEKNNSFYQWRISEETEDVYDAEGVLTKGTVSDPKPPRDLRQKEDPTVSQNPEVVYEFVDEQKEKKKKKKQQQKGKAKTENRSK